MYDIDLNSSCKDQSIHTRLNIVPRLAIAGYPNEAENRHPDERVEGVWR